MTQKTVGYVMLQWTCPNCGAKNPGPQKSCSGCGAAQPADVEFEQMAQEELVQDEADIRRARSGPDVHCAYCGARNPAGAEVCTQCGANLAEAAARAAGKVLGAHRAEPVPDVACPACGAMNPATALKCTQCGARMARPSPEVAPAVTASGRGCSPIAIVGGIVAIGLLAALIFMLTKTSDVVGQVRGVAWMRSVAIEALGPATYQTWRDQVPGDATLGRCVDRVRGTSQQRTANSREVCGTPYTKDTGSGYGEVVQDCVYEVYDEWCEYTVMEWQPVDALVLQGADLNARWPQPQLATDQRAGERAEKYEITFDADGRIYTYTTRDSDLFSRCEIGSRWILKVNQLGSVTAVEPGS